VFFDQTFEFSPYIPKPKMVNFHYIEGNSLFFDFDSSYHQVDLSQMPWQKTDFLVPNYMLAPSISQPNPQ